MRQTGKTTRLIDLAIQTLFKEGTLEVLHNGKIWDFEWQKGRSVDQQQKIATFIDPDAKQNNKAQEHFMMRLRQRLRMEHSGYYEEYQEGKFRVISQPDMRGKDKDHYTKKNKKIVR